MIKQLSTTPIFSKGLENRPVSRPAGQGSNEQQQIRDNVQLSGAPAPEKKVDQALAPQQPVESKPAKG